MSKQKTWSEASGSEKFRAVVFLIGIGVLATVLPLIVCSYVTREEETQLMPTATPESKSVIEPTALPTVPAGWTREINLGAATYKRSISPSIFGTITGLADRRKCNIRLFDEWIVHEDTHEFERVLAYCNAALDALEEEWGN